MGLVFIRQLPAGSINIFTPAAAKRAFTLCLRKISHELWHSFFRRLFEFCRINRIVFNDVYQISRHLPVNFYQFIRIFMLSLKLLKRMYSNVISFFVSR